jgi:hypothetical protein
MNTRRATFGDFASAATRHLESLPPPALQHPHAPKQGDAAGGKGDLELAFFRCWSPWPSA